MIRRTTMAASARRASAPGTCCLAWLVVAAPAAWAAIDTGFIEQPWPRERAREIEAGKYPVRWRERGSKQDGIFAGVRFTAPLDRAAVWKLSSDYRQVGRTTPGVTAVRFLEESETRQIIEVDAKVLWKTLTLRFEVEQDPPKAMRFRLAHAIIGEYRGVCTFTDDADATGRRATRVDLSTWVQPARRVPIGLILVAERMMFLSAAEEFLATCARQARTR